MPLCDKHCAFYSKEINFNNNNDNNYNNNLVCVNMLCRIN